jgi:predicted small secreted protein
MRASRLLVAALLLAALAMSACGGGAGSGTSASTPAQATGPPPAGLQIGIGEQGLAMFADPDFKALGLTKARLVTSYDTTRVRFERDIVEQWLAGARAAGAEPFITFGHSRVHPEKLPSVAEFRASFRAFHKRWPDVKVYAPWNEINHSSQPTSRSPARAAAYYNVVRAECPDCTVLAGDVLDQAGMGRYLARYRRHLKGTPTIWGLHNYADTNRFRDTGLGELLKTVPGDVWLTETGGIVQFGRSFPRDEQRAARAVSFAIDLARKHDRVKRIYLYNWTGAKPTDRFDSGLVGPDGKPRPGYERLKEGLKG